MAKLAMTGPEASDPEPPDPAAAAPGSPAADWEPTRALWLRWLRGGLLGPVVMVLAGTCLLAWLLTSAFHDPRPRGLAIATTAADGSSPAVAAAGLQRRLDGLVPGGFRVLGYGSASAAQEALFERSVVGAYLPERDSIQVLVVGAAGPATSEAVASNLSALARVAGRSVAVTDVVPAPAGDRTGAVAFLMVSVAALGGILLQVLGYAGAPSMPGPLRALAAGSSCLVTGLALAEVTRAVTGVPGGDRRFAVGLSLAAAAFTCALLTWALQRLIGSAGGGYASAAGFGLLGLLANGGPLGPDFVPGWLSSIGTPAPVGAALRLTSDALYFPSAPLGVPLAALLIWSAGATVILIAADLFNLRPLSLARDR